MAESAEDDGIQIRPGEIRDAAAIAAIYNQGIEDRSATFETELRSADERREWLLSLLEKGLPVIVAEVHGVVIGWAALNSYSLRACYRGIGEASVYIQRDWRGQHIGERLIRVLIREAETLGFWKVIGRIFPSNARSRKLCRKCGFREVGIHLKHGKLDGRWLDVLVVECLIQRGLD